jgi:hypothetical protein
VRMESTSIEIAYIYRGGLPEEIREWWLAGLLKPAKIQLMAAITCNRLIYKAYI